MRTKLIIWSSLILVIDSENKHGLLTRSHAEMEISRGRKRSRNLFSGSFAIRDR